MLYSVMKLNHCKSLLPANESAFTDSRVSKRDDFEDSCRSAQRPKQLDRRKAKGFSGKSNEATRKVKDGEELSLLYLSLGSARRASEMLPW